MIKLDEKLKLKLIFLATQLIDCGVINNIKQIKELGIFIMQQMVNNKLEDKIIKAIFELVEIAKSFERRGEIRK